MPTTAQIEEARTRMDKALSEGDLLQRPMGASSVTAAIAVCDAKITEWTAIKALLES